MRRPIRIPKTPGPAWFPGVLLLLVVLLSAGCAVTVREVRDLGKRADSGALIDAFEKTQEDAVRIAVLEAFGELPQDALGRVLIVRQASAGASPEVRLAAVRALGSHEGPEVCAALIAALADPFPSVREMARVVLAAKGAAAHSALLDAAQSNPNPLVRSAAVCLLANASLAQPALRPRVEDLLLGCASKDDAPKVREEAAAGLGKLAVARARDTLVDLSRTDGDASVRMAAEVALQKLGKRAADPNVVVAVLPLRNNTGSKDPEIERLGAQIADYVATRLAASGACQVVDRGKVDEAIAEMKKSGVLLYRGDAPNVPEFGRFQVANQLVYGSIQRQGAVYTLLLNRLEVSTLALVPGSAATVSGYKEDWEQLKVQLTDKFLESFE